MVKPDLQRIQERLDNLVLRLCCQEPKQVDPQSRDLWLSAAKVNREAFRQVLQRQRGDGDDLGVQLRESCLEGVKIGGIRQQGQIPDRG